MLVYRCRALHVHVSVCALMTRKSCAVDMRNAILRNHLNHPCSFMVYYDLFGVFSILVNHYFQVSFNLKVILCVIKITQNTVTAPLTNLRVHLTSCVTFCRACSLVARVIAVAMRDTW